MGLLSIIAVSLLFISESSAICPAVDGIPPTFVNEPPPSTVVSESVFQHACNVIANLVLPCQAAGFPTPTVTWFREETAISSDFVMSDGTLAINITSDDIPRTGILYHCVASNIIGPSLNIAAQLRSRNVNVTLAYFDGFFADNERTLNIETTEGGAMSLICDIQDAFPPPRIEWFANNILLEQDFVNNTLLYLNNGRNLYIQALTAEQRMMRYHCEVITFEGQRMRSPDTYVISRTLFQTGLREYFNFDDGGIVVGELGVPEKFVYVAAAVDRFDNQVDIQVTCPSTSFVTYEVTDRYVITATPLMTDSGAQGTLLRVSLECQVSGENIDQLIFGAVFIPVPVLLLPLSADGPNDFIMDRERMVGGGPVVYSCTTSRPVPITWYYNGSPITSGNGIVVDSDTLTVQDPQAVNSGIYQCLAMNLNFFIYEELLRTWFLEVRETTVVTSTPPTSCDITPSIATVEPTTCFLPTQEPPSTTDTELSTTTSTSTPSAAIPMDGTTAQADKSVPIATTSIWMHFALFIILLIVSNVFV